ncbi:pre-rRNA-processing protein pno1 [Nowakowskiella sp. JEL0407]|nr:pre-rRNA-processing protein pno1 [Nowakowskiella sp. JEL0407]
MADEDIILTEEIQDRAAATLINSNNEDMEDIETPVSFPPISVSSLQSGKVEQRKVPIPPHRMTPLKKVWISIYTPLVEHMKVQVRMNVKSKSVEIRSCKETEDVGAVQKSADFVKAYALGFDIADAIALLRMDDLYIDSFEIKDVRAMLTGDNLSRAIGRIVGKDGKTKYTIENASRTRIVIADQKIHILGTFQNIRIARDSLVALILGSSPGKVTSNLRQVGARQRERF